MRRSFTVFKVAAMIVIEAVMTDMTADLLRSDSFSLESSESSLLGTGDGCRAAWISTAFYDVMKVDH